MQKLNITVIEDEPDILAVLNYNLKREGYDVTTFSDGALGLAHVRQTLPDLVLLDLMLPGMDGLTICKRLKSSSASKHIPVIMVSAKGEESDVVNGLDIGADDYVTKPFSPREILARVKAVLRRSKPDNAVEKTQCITLEELVVDHTRFKVFLKGEELKFTTTEFRLLYHLASNPGRVFTRDQLLEQALENDSGVFDRNIDVHISSIRRKIEVQNKYIETIRSVGYRFIEFT